MRVELGVYIGLRDFYSFFSRESREFERYIGIRWVYRERDRGLGFRRVWKRWYSGCEMGSLGVVSFRGSSGGSRGS